MSEGLENAVTIAVILTVCIVLFTASSYLYSIEIEYKRYDSKTGTIWIEHEKPFSEIATVLALLGAVWLTILVYAIIESLKGRNKNNINKA